MIWILLSIACAHGCLVLLVGAWAHSRQRTPAPALARLHVPVAPLPLAAHVALDPAPAQNQNATRRFVALDAIAACRDSAINSATRRCRVSAIEAAVTAQLLDELQRESTV